MSRANIQSALQTILWNHNKSSYSLCVMNFIIQFSLKICELELNNTFLEVLFIYLNLLHKISLFTKFSLLRIPKVIKISRRFIEKTLFKMSNRWNELIKKKKKSDVQMMEDCYFNNMVLRRKAEESFRF